MGLTVDCMLHRRLLHLNQKKISMQNLIPSANQGFVRCKQMSPGTGGQGGVAAATVIGATRILESVRFQFISPQTNIDNSFEHKVKKRRQAMTVFFVLFLIMALLNHDSRIKH